MGRANPHGLDHYPQNVSISTIKDRSADTYAWVCTYIGAQNITLDPKKVGFDASVIPTFGNIPNISSKIREWYFISLPTKNVFP